MRHTPVILNGVCQILSKAYTGRGIRRDDNVALVGEDLGIPPAAPAIAPDALGTTMNIKAERIGLGLVKSLRIDDPRLDLVIVSSR